jgi:hypothetical protein
MGEHQNSGGEGGWRKELKQAGWSYQLAINKFCAQDNPAFTIAAFASSVVKSEPLTLTTLKIESLLDPRTEDGVLGSARPRNAHNAALTAPLREGLVVCRLKENMALAK